MHRRQWSLLLPKLVINTTPRKDESNVEFRARNKARTNSQFWNEHCSVENHSILVAKTIIDCEVENCEAEVLLLSAKDILDFIGEIL